MMIAYLGCILECKKEALQGLLIKEILKVALLYLSNIKDSHPPLSFDTIEIISLNFFASGRVQHMGAFDN